MKWDFVMKTAYRRSKANVNSETTNGFGKKLTNRDGKTSLPGVQN